MILSDREIKARLAEGDLVIEPLDDPDLQIQPASVDLRLGREFLEFKRTSLPCIHPDRGEEVEDYVEKTTIPAADEVQATLDADERIRRSEFILHPGDFVLGTTHERVEIPPDLIAHVEGRSSLGRLAVVVHASLPYDETVFLWTPEEGYGFHQIGDIVENRRPAHAIAFDPRSLRVGTYPITDYIKNPKQRIHQVTLESGRRVHVTKDHNLFTLDGHGRVTRLPSEDANGRYVMVPGQLPDPRGAVERLDLVELFADDPEVIAYASDGLGAVKWTEDVPDVSRRHYASRAAAPLSCLRYTEVPDETHIAFKQSDYTLPRYVDITPEFGWVLGFYIAGGSVRRKQVQFANTDVRYLGRVTRWFEQFDASLNESASYGQVERLTVCSSLWAKLFEALAGAGGSKNIPASAWNWPKEVREAMLEGVIDGDGCRREVRNTVYTANEDFAHRLQYLASSLGLLSAAHSRDREFLIELSKVWYSGTEWAIDIQRNAHKWGQHVPVPTDLLRSMRDESGMTMLETAKRMGYSSSSSISNVENAEYDAIKRSTLRRFRDCYADAGVDVSRLDHLLAEHVRFERVTDVERTDRIEPTYDLEVQPGGRVIENFLGGRGGVFLSNTAGLCDPGYRGQITLELSNLGTAPVALTPGMRVSQLTFTELTSPAERPYGSERGSKYQDQAGPQASRIGADHEFGGDQLRGLED